MRLVWTIIVLFFPVSSIAVPFVPEGYSVELYASGMGAVTGMAMSADGDLYVADYAGGRILKVTGTNSYQVFISGLQTVNDLTFSSDGSLFYDSSHVGSNFIYQADTDGNSSFFTSGFSFPTSIEAWGNNLYVTNSGDGTISTVDSSGNISTFLSGFSAPNGPFGLSFDSSGAMYFVDHGSGVVYSSDLLGNTVALGSVSRLGGTYTGIGFEDALLVSDVNSGALYTLANNTLSVFVSGFEGKSHPPAIGPNDVVFDGENSLYVGDGDVIWRISRVVPVPGPGSVALFGLGLMLMGVVGRVKSSQAI